MKLDLHWQNVVAAIQAAKTLDERWRALSTMLGHAGIDQINFGLLESGEREEVAVRFLSTMDSTWLAYYGDKRLDLNDIHVTHARLNNLVPYHWNDELIEGLEDKKDRDVMWLVSEAGLRSQWHVTLPDVSGKPLAAGGMALGSSLPLRDFTAAMQPHFAALTTIAHLFYNLSIREVRQLHDAVPRLTQREQDCLAFAAEGMRIDRVAERVGISNATVELHLRNARRKLKARTLPQAVALAIYYGIIDQA